LAVNDAAVRALRLQPCEFEKLTIPQRPGLRNPSRLGAATAATITDGANLEACQADGTLNRSGDLFASFVYGDQPAVLLALMDITERKRAEDAAAFMAQHDGF